MTRPPPGPGLAAHLAAARGAPGPGGDVAGVLLALAEAGRALADEVAAAGASGRGAPTGRVNAAGDRVTALDEWANARLVAALRATGRVAVVASEELDAPVALGPGGLAVCLDPLDGSSNPAVDAPAGTIFGVWPAGGDGDPARALLGPGARQVAAGYLLYGPATVLVYAAGAGVHGFTLDRAAGEFRLTHPALRMPPRGATYAVNEGRAGRWPAPARAFVESLKREDPPYTLRYGGCLAGDFHRTLLAGGVYLYPAEAAPGREQGRIRLLYEAAPLALVAEQAGGRASTGTRRLLEVEARDFHQQVPVVLGSADEVARAEACHRGAAPS